MGADGDRLYLETSAPPLGVGRAVKAYTASDFAGYSVAVYQMSSTVGRGLPATVEL